MVDYSQGNAKGVHGQVSMARILHIKNDITIPTGLKKSNTNAVYQNLFPGNKY